MSNGLRHAKEYLEKHQYFRATRHDPVHPALGLVVVIPCHDEPDPVSTLESLRSCLRPRAAVEVLLVVNACENDDEALRARNRASVDAVHAWKAAVDAPRFRIRVRDYPSLPARHAGVGLARKLGMDEALARLVAAGNPGGIIASLDADCACDENYLTALECHFESHPRTRACTVYFEHGLDGPLTRELYRAITHYELFLRYYRHGLKFAGFPHACYTIGSCMAVRCDAYARHGGMNRRKAGEDFYFLNKLMVVDGVTENNSTRVIPGVRASTRTPFGTGRALHTHVSNPRRPWLTYDARVFHDLAELVSRVDGYYDVPRGAWRGQASLSRCMGDFLLAQGIVSKHAEIRANSASRRSFRKRFFQWFDAFRALKFIHYASRRAYPRQPLVPACVNLLERQGLRGELPRGAGAEALLLYFRDRDRRTRGLVGASNRAPTA